MGLDNIGINSLIEQGITLPEGVSGIDCNDFNVFKKGNIIEAGCEASGGKVIILTVNSVNEIINLECNAKQTNSNRCGNKNIDSETCLICPQIKNTTK